MITLHYLTLLRYPSRYVNRMQVIKTSEQFARLSSFTLFVEMFPKNHNEIYKEYSVQGDIKIRTIGKMPKVLWPQSFFAAFRYRKILNLNGETTVYYIRDVLLAFFLSYVSKKFYHNYFFEVHSLEKFPRFIYERVFLKARGIISTNTEKKREIIKQWQIKEEKILVAHNGTDMERSRSIGSKQNLRKEFSFPEDKKIVMYVGSAQHWKGVEIVYYCAGALPEYTFVIIGTGCDKKENNIIEISRVSFNLVPTYLACADLLIAPYPSQYMISSRWTSPVKVVEYMGSGIPIIASDLPSIREFLDSSTSHLVSSTEDGFRDGIRWAFDHYEEMKKCANNAKERASRYFTWEKRSGRIIDFMEHVA